MLQFIVLGYIPGTSVQLSFADWLLLTATLLVVLKMLGYLLECVLRRIMSTLATSFYPYLKFRRRQDSFTVKLKFS